MGYSSPVSRRVATAPLHSEDGLVASGQTPCTFWKDKCGFPYVPLPALACHPLAEGSADTCPGGSPPAKNVSLCPWPHCVPCPPVTFSLKALFFVVMCTALFYIFWMNLPLQPHFEIFGVNPVCLHSLYSGPSVCSPCVKAVSCCGGELFWGHEDVMTSVLECVVHRQGALRAQIPHALCITLKDQVSC